MVVRLAVGMAVPLEEVARSELLIAVVAREMLWMPSFAQRRDHLAHDWLFAGAAAAFVGRVHSLPVHVCLQAAQHKVQLVSTRLDAAVRRTIHVSGDDGLFSCLVVLESLVRLRVVRHRLLLLLLLRVDLKLGGRRRSGIVSLFMLMFHGIRELFDSYLLEHLLDIC